MKLTDIFTSYNEVKTQHRVMKLFGHKIIDVPRFFKIRDKYLFYEIPNHIEGRYIYSDNETNELISKAISLNKPCAIARFGRSEFNIVQYFYDRKDKELQIKYPDCLINEAINHPGIFSADTPTLIRFSNEVFDLLRKTDILMVWNCFASPEYYRTKTCMIKEYASSTLKLGRTYAISPECMMSDNSWTKYLKGKKVLVIHPFVETIAKQYEKRTLLFNNKDILPEFDLKLIKAPQGIGENNLKEEFGTWHNALNLLKDQMNNTDFDICLVGAGGYGFHLAHYAKDLGKIGIHVAGALQTLFGIKGDRWKNAQFINKNWVSPSDNERPKNLETFIKGEGSAAYW